MSVYDEFRRAWNTAEPLALDRVAERLADAGCSQNELCDALTQLLLEIRAAGADDDTEEIVNGVSDRITGWCAPEWHIHTRDGALANGRIHPPAPVATSS